jgi:poly-gamma-glutamate synthesis protein (capsule biosynthesis protein)
MSAFTLAAAGDIVIRHRMFNGSSLVVPEFQRTIDFLRDSDMSWGSCEVQFSKRGFRTDSTIAYLVDPEVGRDLGRAGYQVLTVATNHTWDFGPDAFLDTLVNLREGGAEPVGGGASPEEAWRPFVRTVNGVRIGILAVSCLVPPYYSVLPGRPGIAAVHVHQSIPLDPLYMLIEPGAPLRMDSVADPADVELLTSAIRALRPTVDLLFVSIHWGYGRGMPLAAYQRPLAEKVIAAGADMILGNHSHSPTGVDVIDGKPVIYSLGKHIAQQDRVTATPRQLEIFADLDPWSVVARIECDRTRVKRLLFVPTVIGPSGLPVPNPNTSEGDHTLMRMRDHCQSLGTELVLNAEGAVLTL